MYHEDTFLYRSKDGGRTWTVKQVLMDDMPGAKTTVDLTGARDKLDAIYI